MKIISEDNFDREIPGTSNDRLVLANCVDREFVKRMVNRLNQDDGPHSPYFYRLVEDDYILRTYDPNR